MNVDGTIKTCVYSHAWLISLRNACLCHTPSNTAFLQRHICQEFAGRADAPEAVLLKLVLVLLSGALVSALRASRVSCVDLHLMTAFQGFVDLGASVSSEVCLS